LLAECDIGRLGEKTLAEARIDPCFVELFEDPSRLIGSAYYSEGIRILNVDEIISPKLSEGLLCDPQPFLILAYRNAAIRHPGKGLSGAPPSLGGVILYALKSFKRLRKLISAVVEIPKPQLLRHPQAGFSVVFNTRL
jgi:hypothetical protein